MSFQSDYAALHTFNPAMGFSENMAETMLKVWNLHPEHHATVDRCVKAQISVERGLRDKPFTERFA